MAKVEATYMFRIESESVTPYELEMMVLATMRAMKETVNGELKLARVNSKDELAAAVNDN